MRPGWSASWRFPGGRFGAALAVASIAVGAAVVGLFKPLVPDDTITQVGYWRFDVATAVLLIVAGVVLRGRPGLAFAILAFASSSVSAATESASYAARSVEALAGTPGGLSGADLLLAAAVFQRTVIPATILTLYATAPERRLGPWVSVVGWGITIATVAAPFLRVAREAASRAEVWVTPWWNELSFQLDQPVPLFAIAAFGLLGSLRAAARAQSPAVHVDRPAVIPDRRVLVAAGVAMVLWIPATILFLNRPATSEGPGDGGDQLLWVPVLLVLFGIVSVRWSRVLAWVTATAAFEAVATLVLVRAIAEVVAQYLANPTDTDPGLPPAVAPLLVASIAIVLFAFAAISLAFLAAWRDAPPTPAEERRWALRGVAFGFGACAWFVASVFFESGIGNVMGIVYLPAFLMPVAVAIVAWRRLVPAVAEAEVAATEPFRPLHYLETIVAEVLTRRAAHQRLAASEERDRLTTELDDLRATVGRLLREPGLALVPAAAGVPWQPQPTSSLRRPSAREIEVVSLVAGGASNEEIARELVLSLKTVETHLRRLFSRYGVTNRTELAVLGVREGWVDER